MPQTTRYRTPAKASFPVMILMAFAAFLLAGCAGGYLDPGPEPAKVRVDLQAKADQGPISWRFGGPCPVLWDWGLYLVRQDGSLARLRPADGQRLKVIQENPLRRDTVFLAPPGKRRLRLIIESYYQQPHAEGHIPISLGGTIEDFQVDLKAGAETVLEFRYP